jgi:hypothetical protein
MMVLKPVLEPALNNYLRIRKEFKNLLAMGFDVPKHRITGAAKGEKTHRRGNTDVYTDHTRFCTVFELTCRGAAVCVNAGRIPKTTGID